jgi:hypothetical protein
MHLTINVKNLICEVICMEKLIKTSEKLDFFFKVMQIVIIIAMVIMLIATTALTFMNTGASDTISGDSKIIDISSIRLEISKEFTPDKKEFLIYTWITDILVLAIGTVIYYVVSVIRQILQPMKEGCPFDISIGYNIRKIANMTIILGLLANAFSAVETIGTIFIFRFSELLAEGAVRKVSANLSFDVTFFIVYFILLLISHIFIYGTELQKLSDETL